MSPDQKHQVLEAIAGHAFTLNKMLMVLQTETDEWAAKVLIDAAQCMAQTLGAMADDAIGGQIAGDMHHWLYGPNFANSGVAA